MKKVTILLIICVLTLSCVSLNSPKDSNKGLLLIPYGKKGIENMDIFGCYRYTITATDRVYKTTVRLLFSNGARRIYLKPGKYLISKTEFIYEEDNHIPYNQTHNPEIYFEIIPGEITVLDKKITTNIFKELPDSYFISCTYSNITDKESEMIIDSISNLKNFELWQIK